MNMECDLHRSAYHFLPSANWMNDPNGVIHWKGQYHLFYQYNPNGPFWGTIHWGHAASNDLVHWTELPIALVPTPGSIDEDGCWSGCAVDNNGIPTLIYSGHRGERELPCIATSTDDLLIWEKHAANPVIASPPQDLEVIAFRDHCVWKENDTWYQLIGSGIKDVGGAVLLYTSRDLIHWEYIHPLLIGDKRKTEPVWTGSMWECPQFFPLGDKYVLIISVWDSGRTYYAAYFIGTYANQIFTPEMQGIIDYGGHFYAPQALVDDRGRRIMWGWLWEGRSVEEQQSAGWAGVMSLPRLLSLRPDNLLSIMPVPELEALRGTHYRYTDINLTPTTSDVLTDIRGDALEIIAIFEPGNATEFGVKVRCSPDHTEETLIVYDRLAKRVFIDCSRSSLNTRVEPEMQGGLCELSPDATVKLHIFLDRSVVEVFCNDRTCVTGRVYPGQADSLGLDLFAKGGSVQLISLDVWMMESIWMNREDRLLNVS